MKNTNPPKWAIQAAEEIASGFGRGSCWLGYRDRALDIIATEFSDLPDPEAVCGLVRRMWNNLNWDNMDSDDEKFFRSIQTDTCEMISLEAALAKFKVK